MSPFGSQFDLGRDRLAVAHDGDDVLALLIHGEHGALLHCSTIAVSQNPSYPFSHEQRWAERPCRLAQDDLGALAARFAARQQLAVGLVF